MSYPSCFGLVCTALIGRGGRFFSGLPFYAARATMGGMYKPTPQEVKELREKTGAGIVAARDALVEANGNTQKAEEILVAAGHKRAEKLSDREAKHGIIGSYNHQGRIATSVQVFCNTDFVARSDAMKEFSTRLAQQIAASLEGDLAMQLWMWEEGKTVEQVRSDLSSRTGENIVIGDYTRLEI